MAVLLKACSAIAILSCGSASLVSAQTTAVVGIAIDSVRGGYLPNAMITLSGTGRSAITDSLGRFRLDSVVAGTYSLRLSHPFLDTLGLSVRTRPTDVKAGETASFVLSIPSPATIIARKCSLKDLERGEAALAGVVLDADTEMPSSGAEVVVAWTDVAVGKKSIDRISQRRSAIVGAGGSYLVCGIPTDLQTGIVAFKAADSTAEVAVSFAKRLVVQSFHLPVRASSDSSATNTSPSVRGTGALTGRIFGEKGKTIDGARVAVESDGAVTASGASGDFHLTGVRAGTRSVSVRKLGYEAAEVSIDFNSIELRKKDITLFPVSRTLETVTVTALRDAGLQRVGFTERRRLGAGTYLGPKEIDGKNAPRLGILLEQVPVLKRYACAKYWIDGHMWSSTSDDDPSLGPDAFLSGAELGAVEVYGPLTAPAEFMAASKFGMCPSVVIWTKNKIGR